MAKKTYHIIKEGIHKEVTLDELQLLNESQSNFTFDVNWYLSNGYVTLESIREKCEGI